MRRLRTRRTVKQMEKALAAQVYSRSSRKGTNGAVVVEQGTIKWLMRPTPGQEANGGVYKRMQRLLKAGDLGHIVTAGDWIWDWVRTEQHRGKMTCDANRLLRGANSLPGWREELQKDASKGWAWWTRVVLRAVLRRSGGRKELLRKNSRTVRQATKQRYTGKGSSDMFRAAMWSLALTEGVEVEGQGTSKMVSGSWKDPAWWEKVVAMAGKLEKTELKQLAAQVLGLHAAGNGAKQDDRPYLVHMCAGWGSGVEEAALQKGYGILAVELQAMRVGAGSTWIQLDLRQVAWRWWVREIARKAGLQIGQFKLFWGGPPCTTMNKGDAGNKRDGMSHNYREGTGATPAHPIGSAKGDLARTDDWLAEGLMNVYASLRNTPTQWVLENPAGYLCRRGYMEWASGHRQQVSYCAYWSAEEREEGLNFQKHTHIWTSVSKWKPTGTTGNGRCKGHKSHDNLQGTKDLRLRCRVPKALVLEWIQAAVSAWSRPVLV